MWTDKARAKPTGEKSKPGKFWEVAYQTSWYDIEVCRLRLTTGILLFPVLSAQSKAAIAKTGIIISAFTYLPSAEKESGFRIAITGFAYLLNVETVPWTVSAVHAEISVLLKHVSAM